MKIIAIYANKLGEERTEIINIPQVKSLYLSKRQLDLCEDFVNLSRKEGESIVKWRLVDNNLRGL